MNKKANVLFSPSLCIRNLGRPHFFGFGKKASREILFMTPKLLQPIQLPDNEQTLLTVFCQHEITSGKFLFFFLSLILESSSFSSSLCKKRRNFFLWPRWVCFFAVILAYSIYFSRIKCVALSFPLASFKVLKKTTQNMKAEAKDSHEPNYSKKDFSIFNTETESAVRITQRIQSSGKFHKFNYQNEILHDETYCETIKFMLRRNCDV